jgi:SAM-dependent methyltransferase
MSNESPDDTRLIAWTGERCVPWADEPQMVAEHLHRYYFAANLVRGKEVLDLASGEGYGSMILAEAASRVVGVEIDPLAVEHARRRYAAPNLSFVEGSALDLRSVPEASFDVVVSFELVEHLSDHERLMSEISRVLRSDGLLIMSTPDRRIYSEASGHVNPHHLRELSEAEFEDLLSRFFPHVAIFGQQCGMASTITPRSPEAGAKGTVPELLSVQRGAQRWNLMAESPALYLVAVASRMPLPPLPDGSTLLDSGHEAGSVPMRLRHPALSLAIRVARALSHAVRRKAALSLRARRRRQQARRH